MTFPQGSPTQPIPNQPTEKLYYVAPTPPPGPKKKTWITSKPAIGIAALVIGLMLGTAGATGKPASATGAVAVPTVTVTATATETATYTADDTATEEPTEDATTEPTAEPTEEATTAAPAPEKKSYKTLSSRGFKLLAKNPDNYIGKTYLLYGEITQFDAATGTDTFRADVGPKKLRKSYGYVDYPQNSMLNGDESKLDKLVQDDLFQVKVTCLGSYSYDTQNGGNTTVPLFQVDWIKVIG
jgi:hypothetical protein